ncbi:hypothetical protein Agabi119p4_3352 [Agaricus bisporus var. burnettii]|uniref:Uncharacterized protein n=1 Tax=Agaricus bisporus var. burnettii TaxID=192524 RepID=A0A8H7F6X4_AGABI|nr:hypothetical protein Agabi119p4_3352 [Agaricus bisporus var. burnettii]
MAKDPVGSRHADGKRKSGAEMKRERNKAKQLRRTTQSNRVMLYRAIENDEQFWELLTTSTTINDHFPIARHLIVRNREIGLEPIPPRHSSVLFNHFTSWAYHEENLAKMAAGLRQALVARRNLQHTISAAKSRLAVEGMMRHTSIDKDAFLHDVRSYDIQRFKQPYPPRNKFICETSQIWIKNSSFIHDRKPADVRIPRKLMFSVDLNRLQKDVKENQSGQFFCGGELVLVVIRCATNRKQLLQFIDTTIEKVIDTRRNVRKEDPGHLSQMGLSAGSRNAPQLNWVKNILLLHGILAIYQDTHAG